jgi:flavin-binding protein dodecin
MVYKYIDIVGTSNNDISEAMNNAIIQAAKTVKNLKWAELGRVTVAIENEKVAEYQAEVRIAFKVMREDEEQ